MHPHFVISTAPNKEEATREEGMRHVKEAIAYVKERVDLENTLVYAPNFFSSDGFSARTLGSTSRSPFGEHVLSEADTIETVEALDKFMRDHVILSVSNHISGGIEAMELLSNIIGSSKVLDLAKLKKEGFGFDKLSAVAQTALSLRERMSQNERLDGKLEKWSIYKGDSFFDEDPEQVGVSWISSNALTDVLDGRKDRRLWVTRLEVQPT
jgi:hypothetical protein